MLQNKPEYFRTAKSTGTIERVDRRGGFRSQGVIRGVSVITRGEALGHDLWVDHEMLEQVTEQINQANKGVKSRFTHPSMSGDGLGKFTGRVMDAELHGDQVVADQHFTRAGHSSPDGDLATYLMDMADDSPDSYGLSIVFDLDAEQVEFFTEDNTDENGQFVSPDPDNVRNLKHARVAAVRAVDSVDEPAANPAGLFHREADLVQEAETVAAFALGLSDNQPTTTRLGLDPDRVRGFVQRFLSSHKLEIVKMAENENDTALEEETTDTSEEETKETETMVVVGGELEVEVEQEQAEEETPETGEVEVAASDARSEAKRFFKEFGARGAVWFAEGKRFSDCAKLERDELKREIDQLRAKQSVSQVPLGEEEPIDFDSDDATSSQAKPGGFASRIRIA